MNEPSHFDHLIDEINDSEAEQQQEAKEQEKQELTSTMMSQDDFTANFIGLHGAAATFSGIKSLALPNSHVNEATAEEVAGVLYETILDIPMLHFMLYPGNKWIGRGFVMIMYVQGMRGAISAEMAEKGHKKQKAKPHTKSQPSFEGDVSPDQAAALGA